LEQNLKIIEAPDSEGFTKMPDFGGEESDFSIEADQIEEIGNALAVKQVFENNLNKVKEALDKIHKGTFGVCDRCKKDIELRRLHVEPAASLCSKCVRKIEKPEEHKR
jgi:RNA polymerase-binding transcription factor DksA